MELKIGPSDIYLRYNKLQGYKKNTFLSKMINKNRCFMKKRPHVKKKTNKHRVHKVKFEINARASNRENMVHLPYSQKKVLK